MNIPFAIEKPKFIHDCKNCIFLGHHEKYDMYFCPNEPTIILRYGNDGYEYSSGLVFSLCKEATNKPYLKALQLALKTEYKNQILNTINKYYKDHLIDFIMNVNFIK